MNIVNKILKFFSKKEKIIIENDEIEKISCLDKGILWSLENEKDQWEFVPFNGISVYDIPWGDLIHSNGTSLKLYKFMSHYSMGDRYSIACITSNLDLFKYNNGKVNFNIKQKYIDIIIKNKYVPELNNNIEERQKEIDLKNRNINYFENKGCPK